MELIRSVRFAVSPGGNPKPNTEAVACVDSLSSF